MESPFEIPKRHDDHAHSDATSHEKLGLLWRTQNMGPLLRIALGGWLEDSRLRISAATSLGSERSFPSACWRKNELCLAQEDQEQAQRLARTQRATPQQRLILSPLALMLSHSEGATMIPALTCVFGSATMQHHPIPTSRQISEDLACTCWLHNTPWGIHRTWRNVISDSNRFRQHCQAGFREETSLYEVRAPIKVLHTEQDTTQFHLFHGDTIQADSELLITMRWRPTDHKRRQLEHLKQQKLIRRTVQLVGVEATTYLDTLHTLYSFWQARKTACAEQKDRTSPTSGRFLVDDRSSCRCSCTKDWYSSRHASTSLPLVQPFSSSPSMSLFKKWKVATLSPTTTIAGQKQLKPCPMTDLEATVDETQFTNSSRKRRASRRNCGRR